MSALRDALGEYLTLRRALGTKLREWERSLGLFLDLLEREGVEFITTELALRWACESQGVQRATMARRLSAVRRFAAWLSAFDPRTEVPPRGLISWRHRRPKPYIVADREIERLMAEAARLPSRTGLSALTYPTLIGPLASTGLRPGEAMPLDVADVDLHGGILVVRQTKFGKSRFVPLEQSTHAAVARYAERCEQLRRRPSTEAFLLSENGGRLGPSAARRTFAILSCAISLRAPAANRRIGRGPRLQDLRHTFATRRLVEWYREGRDVQREMPKLATYLGHVRVADTYWYIESVPELLQLATEFSIVRHQRGAG